MNKKKTLKMYLDIISVIKSELANQLVTANSQGKINIERNELERLISLMQSSVETSGANGYEALSRVK